GLEEFRLAARGRVSVGARPGKRRLARQRRHVHAERLAVARDGGADAAITEDAERLSAQGRSDADLPVAGLERRHLLGKLLRRGGRGGPDVNSAAAYDGVPTCWLDDTMTPRRVHASTSMCG